MLKTCLFSCYLAPKPFFSPRNEATKLQRKGGDEEGETSWADVRGTGFVIGMSCVVLQNSNAMDSLLPPPPNLQYCMEGWRQSSLGLSGRKSWFKWEKNFVLLAKNHHVGKSNIWKWSYKGYSGSHGLNKILEVNKWSKIHLKPFFLPFPVLFYVLGVKKRWTSNMSWKPSITPLYTNLSSHLLSSSSWFEVLKTLLIFS